MGSGQIFLKNESSVRLPIGALRAFAGKARSALRLSGTVAILIAGDEELKSMNRWFRGKDVATDVLSFPSEALGHAGDIAISAETAKRSAAWFGHAVAEELRILILHGMLHIAGFDHEADKGEMARKEGLLRKRFGLAGSLIARAATRRKARR